ncbi:Serine/threonine-protein kinase AFC2 [Hordeum vulgare]|nr:Serine/threonine-protein kinase AFC2 [Hordeum vulgare]
MECLAEMPHAPLDRRPRKRQRLGWDVGPEIPQLKKLCGEEVANAISAMTMGLSSGGIVSSQEAQELFRFATPPLREDDKDGHYVFAVGDNLTSRYRINAKMGEGQFGQQPLHLLIYWNSQGVSCTLLLLTSAGYAHN